MKLELRWTMNESHTAQIVRGVVLVAETKDESKLLDMAFGNKVLDSDGLIDGRERRVECRLADGYREHYVHIAMLPSTSTGDAVK